MGVNIGGLLVAPLVTSFAHKEWGFHLGFGLAAIGMAIGLTRYLLTRRSLPQTVPWCPIPSPVSKYLLWAAIAVLVVLVVLILVATGMMNPGNLAEHHGGAVGRRRDRHLRDAADLQEGGARRALPGGGLHSAVHRHRGVLRPVPAAVHGDHAVLGHAAEPQPAGLGMPISWAQSFNSSFIITLAPVFAALWTKLGTRQPTTPKKFSLGVMLMGAAFLLFLPMVPVASVPVLWIALIMLVATLGELSLSPVGLSLTTKLAPAAFPVMMMALYNLSVALGTSLSGALAQFYSAETEEHTSVSSAR